MALFKHFKHLAAISAVVSATSALAVSCSKDTSGTPASGDDAGTAANASASDLGNGVAGTACKAASDCSGTGGKCATSLGVLAQVGFGTPAPDGYCTAACSDDSECGDGVCIGALGTITKGQCLRACDTNADCGRADYSCTKLDLDGIAAAAADAGIGAGVDAGALPEIPKACMPTPKTVQLADGIAGKACTSDTNCGAGTCQKMNPTGGDLPGGYCSGACLKDSECGAGAVCLGAIQSQFLSNAGGCLKTCTSNSDCRTPDYECAELPARSPAGTPRLCAVPAADAGTPAADAGTPASDAGASDAGVADAR